MAKGTPEKYARNMKIVEYRKMGMSFANIGKIMKITRSRASKIYERTCHKYEIGAVDK
jgi:predicted XRE-type DNA-binding protein